MSSCAFSRIGLTPSALRPLAEEGRYVARLDDDVDLAIQVRLLHCVLDQLDQPLNSRDVVRFDTDEEGLQRVHGEMFSVSSDGVQDVRLAAVLGIEGDCVREVRDLCGLIRDECAKASVAKL